MATVKMGTLVKVLLVVIEICTCGGFLLHDGDTLSTLCFPQDQFCSCIGHDDPIYIEITCSAKNLTKFPNFTKISDQIVGYYKSWGIILTDNELTTIPNGLLANFNPANMFETNIYLGFERNKISTIENGAFVGVIDVDMALNLSDNRIATLPLALKTLVHLRVLSLQGNPILAFDSAVINSMARWLYYLQVGYDALVSGNKELSVLNLNTLSIYGIPSDYGNLTFNPFLFFRNTMSDMFIGGTELTTLPCSLIDGPKMKYFYLRDAANISANSVFDCPPSTTLKVFDLEIMFSGLEEFPNILKFTPSLLGLNLMHSKISNVNEKFIPLHNKLEVLNLSHNRLRIIPSFFSRFGNLKFLYIEFNQITYIAPESNVLSVVSVCAGGNPWTHTGVHCDDSYNIEYMYIDNTTVLTPNPPSF